MIEEILAAYRDGAFDFREFANPADPLAYRFEEWVPYYRLKHAIAKVLQPASILEIGVRFGYSAQAFLAASPGARYVGVDNDTTTSGGSTGALEWAGRALAGRAVELIRADTQGLEVLPGGPYDLIHVDGQQDGDGTHHDLTLALEKGRYILLDRYFSSQMNLMAASLFLEKYRSLIEYAVAIPGYAGELLIHPRPEAARVMELLRKRSYAALRTAYDSTYYLTDCGGHEVFKSSGGQAIDERLLPIFLLASPFPSARILDVGCGRGELARALADAGARVTGVDYSSDAIAIAKSTHGAHPRLTFLEADVLEYPFPERFDVVIASDLVEHLEPAALDALLRRIAALLDESGLLIIHTAPNLRHYQTEYAARVARARDAGVWLPRNPRTLYEDLMHINEQTPEGLKASLERAFKHALVWTATLPDAAGTLARGAPGNDLSIFAVASRRPIDAEAIASRITQRPLNPAGVAVELDVDPVPRLAARASTKVGVTVKNVGKASLASLPPNPVNLAYHWRTPGGEVAVFDGVRTVLPAILRPAREVRMQMSVEAPAVPGAYVLEATLVQEGCFWFEQHERRLPTRRHVVVID